MVDYRNKKLSSCTHVGDTCIFYDSQSQTVSSLAMSRFIRKAGNSVIISLHNGPYNALTHTVRKELMVNLQRAAADRTIESIILTGLDHFCVGPEYKELNRGPQQSPSTKDIIAFIDTFEKPVIANLGGAVLGSGLELALACHWRVADNSTLFGFPESSVGLIPGTKAISCRRKEELAFSILCFSNELLPLIGHLR